MKVALSFLILFVSAFSQGATKVAITIDDLPTAGALPAGVTWEGVATKMIAAFKKHKVPEVYAFINAGKVTSTNDAFEVLRLWKSAGYPFANHTFLHEDIENTSVEEFQSAIQKNEPMLKRLSRTANWRYFRYPFLREGSTKEKRNSIRRFLKKRGYSIAQVTIDFEDWSWNSPYARCKDKSDTKTIGWLEKTYLQNATDMLDRAETLSKALFKREVSHILLIHIGGFDAEMLDSLLTAYEKKGVEFIPLSEAVLDPIYSIDPALPAKWGSELTYQILNARKQTLTDVGMSRYEDYPEQQLEDACL